jgi:hypothetical protein
MSEGKSYAQLRAELEQMVAEVGKPKRPAAEVVEFPQTLVKAERERQAAVAEQDRQRREAYQRLCDATWAENRARWAAEERVRLGGFHRGWGDPDWPA